MIPTVVTRTIGEATAEAMPFTAYPKGAELLSRVLRAAKPSIDGFGPLLQQALSAIDAKSLEAAVATKNWIGLVGLMLASDKVGEAVASLLSSLPDVIGNIIADTSLVPDLLAMTTVVVDGTLHKLNTAKAVGAAVGYDYALLTGLVRFAIEVNFAGPLAAAFGGLLPGRGRASPAATPTPSL